LDFVPFFADFAAFFFAAILISAINMNRAVWRSIEQAKAQAAGNKEVASGVYAPMLPGGGRR